MKMKKNSYTKGDGIKSISKFPDWLIKIIGWLDSRKTPDVATAHLDKYLDTLAKNEKDEALLAEEALRQDRAKGNKCLYTILNTDTGTAPGLSAYDNSPAGQRAHSKALAKYNDTIASVSNAKESLVEIDAAVTSGNLVFEERLEKTRNTGMRQIDVYIKGVRSGKQHCFAPEIHPDDTARLKYYAAHKEYDDLIHQYAKEA